MLSRFEHAHVDGLSDAAAFVELDQKTPAQVADLILERLALNEGKPQDRYTEKLRRATLKRYTELPFLLHMLRTKKLALLSPKLWDDRNDALYMERYRQRQCPEWKSVLALCLTKASETYHHWKVFAAGPSGVCIEFNQEKLVSWAKAKRIHYGHVRYYSLSRARQHPATKETLAFRKRHAFEDDDEFRLVCKGKQAGQRVQPFDLDLCTIEQIVVNPWMTREVFESVKESIRAAAGCNRLKVRLSQMLTNQEWAAMAERDA